MAAVAIVTSALPIFLVAAAAVQLQAELRVGAGTIGLVIGARNLAAATSAVWLGRLVQRQGAAAALRLGIVGNGVSLLAVSISPRSWIWFLVLLSLGGLTSAIAQPAADLWVSRTVSFERHGTGYAVKQSAGPGAALIAGAAVPTLILTVGWRWTFALAALITLASVTLVPSKTDESPPSQSRGELERDAPPGLVVLLAAVMCFGGAAAIALASFFVSFAASVGISEGVAGPFLALGSAGAVATRIVLGLRADRGSGRYLLQIAGMLSLGAVAFASFVTGHTWTIFVFGPIAFAAGWGWPGLLVLAVARLNPNALAAASGVVLTGAYLGAVVGPAGYGLLLDHTSFGVAWIATAASALTAAGCVLAARRVAVAHVAEARGESHSE